jgi:hypothetical protein
MFITWCVELCADSICLRMKSRRKVPLGNISKDIMWTSVLFLQFSTLALWLREQGDLTKKMCRIPQATTPQNILVFTVGWYCLCKSIEWRSPCWLTSFLRAQISLGLVFFLSTHPSWATNSPEPEFSSTTRNTPLLQTSHSAGCNEYKISWMHVTCAHTFHTHRSHEQRTHQCDAVSKLCHI